MSMQNKKKRGQAYQNKQSFRVDNDSKLSKRILKTPLDLLCQRCYDQIKWKIDYKKYKPLTQPSKCVDCKHKNIVKAYRTLCDACAKKKVEKRVTHEQALLGGLVEPEESEKPGEDEPTKPTEVAQQVIPEEANEEEETKGEEEEKKSVSFAKTDEVANEEDDAQASAATTAAAVGQEDEEGKGAQDEEEEEEKPKALTLDVQTVLSSADMVIKTKRCSKCTRPVVNYASKPKTRQDEMDENEHGQGRIMEIVGELKERMKRKVLRQLRSGEIGYDPKLDKLVYCEDNKEFVMDAESDVDSEDF